MTLYNLISRIRALLGFDDGLPSCENCGRIVFDDMDASHAPYCSEKCQKDAQ